MIKRRIALFCVVCLLAGMLSGCGQKEEPAPEKETTPVEEPASETKLEAEDLSARFSVNRLGDGPIIYPGMEGISGENIQGPALIKVPDWVENPMGKYYLYFAEHKGDYIRLAYADELTGPWTVYEEGSLHLSETNFLAEPPQLTPEQEEQLPLMAAQQGYDPDSKLGHSLIEEATMPHIASPEILIDDENQQIIMYFHGLRDVGIQTTGVATSKDGIHFEQMDVEDLGKSYMRIFEVDGTVYGIAMPGQLYKADDLFTGFTAGQSLLNPNARHHDVMVVDDTLYIFWTQVGDAPEQIYVSTVDVSKPWEEWKVDQTAAIMKAEYDWEGADMPVEPSIRSTAYGRVNQLRDPYIYEEDGQLYLLYAVAGESGIAIAELTMN